ncbi:MAG: hypothetical protein H6636_04480 [Anaerolineales bacterium]|nr:hypothetical protein [Anaerolineales bacterium]
MMMSYAAYPTTEYRQQEIMSASSLRLIIMAYDFSIRACEQEDFSKATKGITLLRDALNFDYAEVSTGLFRIYQWCLDSVRAGDYAEAKKNLSELRSAWVTVENRLENAIA